ncbi:hypothetical protein NE686_17530 [Tissierella carlieri]|uniref:Uncharacterized protein n=1 Tax=Tissierella carlieri TaxID=689904 RepID=A0ABT1SEV9_9FIRM|nr:hypothetical protein [Tissierella carlieri]MCQ4924907.1 hypothetical protein [Tissierella carlieri]
MERKGRYKINLFISVDLDRKARDRAVSLGLTKAGKGLIGKYITMLIMTDLKEKPKYDIKEIDYGKRKRLSIPFPVERMDEVKMRAEELGFVWQGEANVSEYINFLLSQNL